MKKENPSNFTILIIVLASLAVNIVSILVNTPFRLRNKRK